VETQDESHEIKNRNYSQSIGRGVREKVNAMFA